MKKILSIALASLMVIAMCLALVSCGHECEFKTEWSKDATHHWHDCVGKRCELVSDKAEHAWNEGEITTPATQGASGVKTFTCEVCGGTKTETLEFTGLSQTEWNSAFDISNFKNFSFKEVAIIKATGITMETTTEYLFTETAAKLKAVIAGQTEEKDITRQTDVSMYREAVVDSIIEIAGYSDYEYDAETKTYKANKSIEIQGEDATDVTLKFDDSGKIIEATYSLSTKQGGVSYTATSTVTIEYGNVTL